MVSSRVAVWAFIDSADADTVAAFHHLFRPPVEPGRTRPVSMSCRGLPIDGAAPPESPTINSVAPNYLGYDPICLGIGVVVVVVASTAGGRLRHRREPSIRAPRPLCRSGGGASPGSGQLRTQRALSLPAGVGAATERALVLCRPDRVAHPARGQR